MTDHPPEPPAEPTRGGVQSVARVFDLLELIADAGGQISLSDLATRSGLPLATIHRLLRTLVGVGYVRQLPSRRYSLGARLIWLGERAAGQLGPIAAPELTRLVADLGESANLAIRDGDFTVYVAQQASPHQMRMFTEVGRRAHLHDTGVGKAILSTLEDDAVRGIVARTGMPTPTSRSHGEVESLLDDLHQIRERGYAIDDEEQELGVRCYAVPLAGTRSAMALSVSGPLARVDTDFADRAVPALRAAAARLSQEFQQVS